MSQNVELGIRLTIDNREVAGKLSASVADIKKLAGATGDIGKQAAASLSSIDRMAAGLKGIAALAATAFSGREIVRTLAEFDRLNASLKTVTGSLENAQVASAFIKRFATETPYELADVTEAFIRLKSMGLDASEASLRSYGNTAAAMGKPIMQFIEAVADAATGEFERLKEFGIKTSQQNDKVTFSFRGTSTTIKNEAGAITAYLQNIGRTDFSTGMADQMHTIDGAVSNLKDSFSNLVDYVGNLGVRDALMKSFAGVTEFIQGFQRQLNAVFGTGTQAAIDAYELRLSELRGKLENQRSALKTPLIGGLLASPDEIARTEQSIVDMTAQLDKLRATRAAATAEQEKALASTSVPAGGGSSASAGKTKKPKGPSAALLNDPREEIQARLAAVKDGMEAERMLLDQLHDLEILKAGESAERRLQIEQKYQLDALSLKQDGLQKEIALKRDEAGTIKDQGQKAKALQELARLEREYQATIQQRQVIEQSGEIKMAALNKQKQADLRNLLLSYDQMGAAVAKVQDDARRAFDLGASDQDMAKLIAAGNKQIDDMKDKTDTLSEATHQFGMSFQSAMSNAIVGGQSFGDVLKGLATDIVQMGVQMAIVRPVAEALFGSGKAGGGSGLVGAGLTAIGSFLFADGGVMTSKGPLPLKAYAGGGIASSPQLALFGEGRMNEAYVPLPDGRSIPVSLRVSAPAMPTTPGGGNTHIEIVDQRGKGQPVEAQTTRDASGNERIRLMIRDEVKGAMARGDFDSTMASSFGVRRAGMVR